MNNSRKVILYIAASIDGYIAREDGDVDWLSTPELSENIDYGYTEFINSVDTVLMGYGTYQKSLSFGAKAFSDGKEYFVFTREHADQRFEYANPVEGNMGDFVRGLKSRPGKHIWMMGGGRLIQSFLEFQLIDEMMLFVIPIILGDGLPLFVRPTVERQTTMVGAKHYANGVQLLHYEL